MNSLKASHEGTQTIQLTKMEQTLLEFGKVQWRPHCYHKGALDQNSSI